jgi:class 3 adenylate cyclase
MMESQPKKPSLGLHAGTVTFLFTDIEGSTRLLKQLGDRLNSGVQWKKYYWN